MSPEIRKSLFDMHNALLGIELFTQGKTVRDLEDDLMLRLAVERQFEIIGEALNRLRKADPSIAERISDARGIIRFRNVLSHGYDNIDQSITWRIITEKLPVLKGDLEKLLSP